MDDDAELRGLAHGLVGHGERRENQHGAASPRGDEARPFDLLGGLAEPEVLEERGTSAPNGPFHDCPLPIEKRGIDFRFLHVEPNGRNVLALCFEKVFVFHRIRSPLSCV